MSVKLRNFFRFWRLYFLYFCFLAAGATLAGRLFFLQIEHHGFYKALAQGQYKFFETLIPSRGEIFFRERVRGGEDKFIPAAVNSSEKSVVASPREIRDAFYAARALGTILGLDEAHTKAVLDQKNSYAILKKAVSDEEEAALKKESIAGIYLKENHIRVYPEKTQAAHLLGFVGHDEEEERGQYGIEEMYNDDLIGKKNRLGEKKFSKNLFTSKNSAGVLSRKGTDLYLTVDYNIQYMAEKLLSERVKRYNADGGEIIVMDPKRGSLIALAAEPSFDPNSYSRVGNLSVFLNPVVEKQFEPGSVFKPFIVAGALDTKKLSLSTRYYDRGYVAVGPEVIKNFEEKVHGEQQLSGILEKSINTGMVYIAQLFGKQDMKDYIRKFGFGALTNIDLPGEIKGDIANLNDMRDIHYATASFGQGIATTPIQLISGFSVFANEGKKVSPFVVEKKVYPDGRVRISEDGTKEEKRVISPETARLMTSLLINVIEQGTGKRARIPGYFVAGKTGTAQVALPRGGYGEEAVHTFVGYAPALDPRFIILVKITNPKGVRAAEGSVVPLFKDLAEYIINYYEIPPDMPITSQ